LRKALTAAAIERLKPCAGKRLEISDGLLPALRVVVSPRGGKSYAVRFKFCGESRKLTIGPVTAFSLAEVRAKARDALCEVARGNDPCKLKKASRAAAVAAARQSDDLLERRLDEFMRRHVSRLKSCGAVTQLLVKELAPWRGRLVQEIAKRDVIALVEDVHERGAPTTARNLLANVKRFFSWLIERDVLQVSPCSGVKPPSRPVQRGRVLSDIERRLVLLAANETGYPFGPMIWILALTGARRREVSAMEWRELILDGNNPVWSLPAARTKKSRPHDIPLTPSAVHILGNLPRITGQDGAAHFVFTTTGITPVSGFSRVKQNLDSRILAIARREDRNTNLEPWRVHDMRRTMASGMARAGIQLPVIERCLNHVSGSFAGIVGVYQRHSFADEKREAFQRWAEFVEGLVDGHA
jgi:integrase